MVRIRYLIAENGNELISKSIEGPGAHVRVRIKRENGVWRVVLEQAIAQENGAAVWKEKSLVKYTTNLAVAKAKGKQFVREEGVQFLEEVRRRRERNV